jgi:hypothetical protein
MKLYSESRIQIRNTLQHVVDGTAGPYELDDCFSGPRFSDPRLQAMRDRLWQLPEEFPPETKAQFCGKGGIEIMLKWIEELSDENA